MTRALTKDDVGEARERPTMDDENKTFRTRLVASWMLSNAALALAISNIGGWLNIEDAHITHKAISRWLEQNNEKRNMYFTVLLYGTFLLSMVRFLGVCGFFFLMSLKSADGGVGLVRVLLVGATIVERD